MSINERQDEIIEEFSVFEDWFDKYSAIIDMAGQLPVLDDAKKTEQHLIHGCQSRVWIDAYMDEQGNLQFEGDSDAIIVKGILALLISVLSGHTPAEISASQLYFIDAIGLKEHLSPTRSNGLVAMLQRMYHYAEALK